MNTKSKRLNIYLTNYEKEALKALAIQHRLPMTRMLLKLLVSEYINNASMDISNVIRIHDFKI